VEARDGIARLFRWFVKESAEEEAIAAGAHAA
jgi:hypothetical protein